MKLVVSVLLVLGLVGLSYSVGTLYGLDTFIARVIKIDPKSAAEVPIGRFSYPNELTPQQVSSIDVQRKIYYLIAENETAHSPYLIGLSLKNGVLVHSVKLPYSEPSFQGLGQYCAVIPSTGAVLTLGKDRVRNRYHILHINATTNRTQVIGSLVIRDRVLAGAAAYDPVHDLFWFQVGTESGVNNYAYSIKEKKCVHNSSNVDSLETMNWDQKTQRIVGIGFVSGGRVLISLNPVSGETTVVAKIPNYYIINAQLAALDETNRILYSYLQPQLLLMLDSTLLESTLTMDILFLPLLLELLKTCLQALLLTTLYKNSK